MNKVLKKAEDFRSLRELGLSKKTLAYVKRKGLSFDQIVLYGRITAYGIEHGFNLVESNRNIRPSAKWRISLAFALDNAGYIRHDLDMRSFKVNRLYNAVFDLFDTDDVMPMSINGITSNETYEEFVPITDEQMTLIRRALEEVLTEREYAVLCLRLGLEDDVSHDLEYVGRCFNITKERVRQIEAKALRKVKREKNSLLIM